MPRALLSLGCRGMAAIAVAALIVLASIPASQTAAPGAISRAAGQLPLSAGGAVRPASMGLSASQAGVAAAASPGYDEQIGVTFTQDLPALAYNVTVLAQVDANGYGPAYLLNGLSSAGYWYQVGISYHWPSSSGSYNPTFGFSYQVYGPSGKPVFPANGGAGLGSLSGPVHSGDSVLLSLTFSGSSVQMLVQDWNTGAIARTSYTSAGSSSFVGDKSSASSSQGFFTGLMTEWYHALPSTTNVGRVTYTNRAVGLSSAWMWVDEFLSGSPGSPLFIEQTPGPVVFANEQQLYPFSSHGITMYGSAHQFITGSLNATSSRVSITPAGAESSSPGFEASYTLAGLKQTSDLSAGTGTLVEADPGTTVIISVNSTGTSADERWVFGGAEGSAVTAVTFAAGSNVTYAYYHLVQQRVAYAVAGGGKTLPAGSAPRLVYEQPPALPSATPAQVAVTQPLGTSPVEIFVIEGSDARLDVTIPGASGERWAASSQVWTISAPNSIPNPIRLYDQYQVSVRYSILGGGTPPVSPEFNSTSFGGPAAILFSGSATTGWFDVGSAYSFSSLVNGTAAGERWVSSLAGNPGAGALLISSPNQEITAGYVHQYYVSLAANDARGGQISRGPGWLDAGSSLSARASASPQWQFEAWSGSGVGSYTGTSTSLDVTVMGPLSENATFYVELSIAADQGTNVAFSYGSGAGTVEAGSSKVVYLPPSANVALRASPSLFVYSFASWKGAGLANATRPSLSFAIDAPGEITGTSSYNYPVLFGIAALGAVVVLAGLLWSRNTRKGANLGSFTPGTAFAQPGPSLGLLHGSLSSRLVHGRDHGRHDYRDDDHARREPERDEDEGGQQDDYHSEARVVEPLVLPFDKEAEDEGPKPAEKEDSRDGLDRPEDLEKQEGHRNKDRHYQTDAQT